MNNLHTLTDVLDVISGLSDCMTEGEANDFTSDVIQMLGAQWFVYTTMLPPHHNKVDESFRFFIGCRQELCEIYSRRMWMMNDPFFEYARTNSAPVAGSQVKARTPGQQELMRVSAEYGFRSGLVVPTHTSMASSRRMGLLYVGSELPVDVGEPMLMRKRVQFGALGMELLLWWSNRLKNQAMRKFSLIDEEVEILQLSKKGKVASEIAAFYDINLSTTYKRLNMIKEKFNVDKIEQAVIEADSQGLLG